MSINQDKTSKVRAGSPYYMAPENFNKYFTKKSDAWAIGVIIHFLLAGKLPFMGEDSHELFNKIKVGNYNKKLIDNDVKISFEGKYLIKSLLIVDEKLRISVDDVINSSWIKKFEVSNDQKNLMIMKFFKNNNIVDNFIKFANYSTFKKEILFSIAKICQDEEVCQLKQIFTEFDTDNSGSIDQEEVKHIFSRLGISATEVGFIFIF